MTDYESEREKLMMCRIDDESKKKVGRAVDGLTKTI